jgi:tetratricopeptide (TPR) repeat protein
MPLSTSSLAWLAGYGMWLPVLFFSSIVLACALFSPAPARTLRRGVAIVLPVAILTPLFRYMPRHMHHDTAFAVGVFFVLTGGITAWCYVRYRRATPMERQFGTLAAFVAAHRKGDYEAALQLCDGPALRQVPAAKAELFRGALLYQLRRLNEADSHLRKALALRPSASMEALILDQLGQVQTEQGRNDDAARSFQRAAELDPERGVAFESEAALYLRGKYQLEKALELAQHAVELDRKQTAEVRAVTLSTSLAALAWALAANGRTSDARETVREALDQFKENSGQTESVPVRAELEYLAGQAILATGDRDSASEYFRKVAQTDTKGNFGFLARQELAALG